MKTEKGMMLVTILMLTFLLVMLTTSMILISSQNLNITGLTEKKSKALQSAEAGVEYAFYQLYDPNWGTSITSDITESLGDGQSFTIIFNPSATYHSKNNLMNKDPNGITPAYSAEIICRGTYKGTEKVLRAIFVRDDEFQYPLVTGGYINLKYGGMGNGQYLKIKGKTSNSPGRIHTNGNMILRGNNTPLADLNRGFISSVSTVSISSVSGTIKTKEKVLPVKIPDINIQEIINRRDPNCLQLTSNKFYLIGYFEHDPNAPSPYCIPHTSYMNEPYMWNKPVHYHPYKLGVAVFNESSGSTFISNYSDYYSDILFHGNDRNFYKYYAPIDFWDANDINFNNNLMNNLGMTMTVDPNNHDFITMTLQRDLYIPHGNSNGLIGTGVAYEVSVQRNPYIDTEVKLDFNGHKIYGNLFLAVPPTGNDPNSAFVSEETIDMLHSYSTSLVTLSDKSIRLAYQATGTNGIATYNGIIYARDDILIQMCGLDNNKQANFNGSIVCKNINPNFCVPSSPMTTSWAFFEFNRDNQTNFFLCPYMLNQVSIIHSNDGLDTIVSLRGNDFNVRKQSCEVLK
jgi:hypothetical protein